jgi:signal transduction histidine kinase
MQAISDREEVPLEYNARKAMIPVPEGEHGDLLLEGSREEGGYRVRITDTGKGIPAAELGRITEAFYMVDKSRARAQGGAGLGLALCTRIVELHGGRMEIQSVEGKGTQVTVHLKGGTADEAAE